MNVLRAQCFAQLYFTEPINCCDIWGEQGGCVSLVIVVYSLLTVTLIRLVQ